MEFEIFISVALIACLALFVISALIAAEAVAKVRRLERRLDYYMEVKAAQRSRAQARRIAQKLQTAGGQR